MRTKRRQTNLGLILPIIYLAIIAIALGLRGTPLNKCEGGGLFVFCLGKIDGFLFMISLPGWIFWLIIAKLPQSVSGVVFNLITAVAKTMKVASEVIYILFSFALTTLLISALGRRLDRRRFSSA